MKINRPQDTTFWLLSNRGAIQTVPLLIDGVPVAAVPLATSPEQAAAMGVAVGVPAAVPTPIEADEIANVAKAAALAGDPMPLVHPTWPHGEHRPLVWQLLAMIGGDL